MAYNITRTKRGYYCVRVQVGGVRRTAYATTEAEAREKLRRLQAEAMLNGGFPNAHRRTLADLVTAWLETANIRPTTRKFYEEALGYVLPVMGSLRLDRVTPERIERLYRELGDAKAKRVHGVLKTMFNVAIRWGWLVTSPLARVRRPRAEAKRRELWTPEQFAQFVEAAAVEAPFLCLLAVTGLRLGESLGLQWGDVSDGYATLTVRRSAKWLKGRWVFGEPKTRAGARVIALPQVARDVLRRLREARPQAKPTDFVFPNRRGDAPMCFNAPHLQLRRLCDRLGLPYVSPHGLRHLCGSVLLTAGAPLAEVSAMLGHSSSGVTARVYTHALRDGRVLAEMMDRLTAR